MNYLKNNERRVDESTFNRLSQLSGLNECIGFLLENRGAHDPESLVENCRAITHYSVTAMEYASRALIGIGDVTQKRVDELMGSNVGYLIHPGPKARRVFYYF